ncbi:MAG: hypothetical protein SFT68_03025 [Rickettsiaceae bacterium]|nr:hypothetical protein [Rickettsiaceae bacterium]
MKKLIKLNTPFEKIRLSNITPEIKLKRAIIMQAVIDAINVGKDTTSMKIALEARQWLSPDNEDFIIMCHECALEPDYIIRKTKEAIIYNSINSE